MLRRLLFALCITVSKSQLINMQVCTDFYCNTNCVRWIATSGKCTPCQGVLSSCSNTNPSSIVTTSSITFYSDSNCNTPIVNSYKMPLLLDNTCYQLYIYGNTNSYGSYKASDTSMIIGITVGTVVVLIIGCVICYMRKRQCCCNRYQPPQQNTAVIINDQEMRNLPLSNYGYNVYPVITEPYVQPQIYTTYLVPNTAPPPPPNLIQYNVI